MAAEGISVYSGCGNGETGVREECWCEGGEGAEGEIEFLLRWLGVTGSARSIHVLRCPRGTRLV